LSQLILNYGLSVRCCERDFKGTWNREEGILKGGEFGSATERVKEGRREIQIHRGATLKITLERVA
jgi:hypothetical protein